MLQTYTARLRLSGTGKVIWLREDKLVVPISAMADGQSIFATGNRITKALASCPLFTSIPASVQRIGYV